MGNPFEVYSFMLAKQKTCKHQWTGIVNKHGESMMCFHCGLSRPMTGDELEDDNEKT